LEYNPERPLIALISRLVDQKGIDLIRDMQYELQNLEADFVFIGSGDAAYENLFIWLSNNTPNIRTYVGYRGDLANLIYAGSDFFLMPSKFEPCGLGQLIALRYGTIPLVRETGGLADTVSNFKIESEEGNGFSFNNYSGHDFYNTIMYALSLYYRKDAWNQIVQNGFACDFSWIKSAKEYIELYKNI
jgi:starch synthase